MDRDDVAGLEPAVLGPALRLLGRVVVAGGDPRAAHLELAHRLAVPRQDVPVDVAVAQLDERQRPALHRDVVELRLLVGLRELAGQLRGRRDGRGLGHAPAVHDVHAVPLLEAGDHRARRGRAADEHALHLREIPLAGVRVEQPEDAEPDRRHAGRPRHLFLHERVEQALRIEVRARDRRASRRSSSRGTGSPTRSRGTSAPRAGSRPTRRSRAPSGCRRRRRACAASSSGASTERPSASRSCRSCNTSPRLRSRRARGRARRRRSAPASSSSYESSTTKHVLDRRAVEELLEQRHEALVDDHRACPARESRCRRGRSDAGAG